MSHPADFRNGDDHHDPDSSDLAVDFSHSRSIVLLIEDRPFMGEIFSRALMDADEDIDVRIVGSLDEADQPASLAVLSFVQRSSDPLFIAFLVQRLKIRIGSLPLLVVTDSADPAVGDVLEEAGVRNWLTAAMGFAAVIAAVRDSLALAPRTGPGSQGFQAGQSRAARRLMPAQNPRSEIHLALTEREIDVLALLQKGKQNKIIAHALNISESTAKVHIRNIMRKFHLRNRTEVALMCGASMNRPEDVLVAAPGLDGDQMGMPAIIY